MVNKITKTQNTFKSQASMEDSDQQLSESGAMIGSNDDLLTEILLRVPATSIFRFRFVSKHWRWLLRHKHFTLRYDKLSKSPGLFLRNDYVPYDDENPNPRFVSLDFCTDPNGIKILQSCNGLLLCCSNGGEKWDRKYYVFNPTTKQFAIIPSVPGGFTVRESICFMGLAFHQTDCVHYKVVCVRKIDHRGELFRIHIYSSDTKNWKISIESFSTRDPTFDKGGVYCNGAIHWVPIRGNHLCFKVEEEQLQVVPLPVQVASSPNYYNKELRMYFGESRGHLHLVTKYRSGNDLRMNVYEMLGDHSGWFVKYQVDLEELWYAIMEMMFPEGRYLTIYYFNAIDVVRGEKDEDTFIVMEIFDKIIKYNVHDKSCKNIFTFTSDMSGLLRGHRYTVVLSSF